MIAESASPVQPIADTEVEKVTDPPGVLLVLAYAFHSDGSSGVLEHLDAAQNIDVTGFVFGDSGACKETRFEFAKRFKGGQGAVDTWLERMASSVLEAGDQRVNLTAVQKLDMIEPLCSVEPVPMVMPGSFDDDAVALATWLFVTQILKL